MRAAAAVLADDLEAMLQATADSFGGLRDRALLLVGFAGALRRSERVASTSPTSSFATTAW